MSYLKRSGRIGVHEGGSLKVKVTPAGVLLIPRFEDPVKELSNLPVNRPVKPTIEALRELGAKFVGN